MRDATLVDEETVSVTFDVNIKGPSECHNTDLQKECCSLLFEMDRGIMRVNTTEKKGKTLSITSFYIA